MKSILLILLAFSSSAFAQQAKEEYFLDTLWTVEVPNFGDKLTAKYPTDYVLSEDRKRIYFNGEGLNVMDIATGKYQNLVYRYCHTIHPNAKEFLAGYEQTIFSIPDSTIKHKFPNGIGLQTAKYSPNGKYLVTLGASKFLNEVFVFETENYTLLMKDTLFDISMFYDGEGIYFSPSGNIAMISSRAGDEKNPNGNWYHHIIDIENKKIVKLNHRDFDVYQILDSNRFAYGYGRNLPANGIYNYITKKVDFEIPMLFDEKIYEEVHKFYNNSDILVSYSKAPDYKFLEAILYNFITKDKKIINYKSKIALRSVTWLKDSLFIYGLFTGNNAPGGVKWSILTFKSLTGMDEHQTITEIYPNPSNKIITIGGLPIDETIKIMIKSISGNLLKNEIKNTGEGSIVIDISDFSIGTYIININGQNFNANYKIIKGE